MKRADLVTGQHYAYCERRELSLTWTRKVELLDTQIYTRSHRFGPDRGKILLAQNQTSRPTKGAGYYGNPYGLLVKLEDGTREIVMPQNLHMTWEAFEVWKAEREAENAKAAAQHAELRKSQASAARELNEALAAIDMAGQIRVTTDRAHSTVRNDVLLKILRRAAANEMLAKVLDNENDQALTKRDQASINGSGSNNNLRTQGRHDGYAAGVRSAAELLRGAKA